MHDIECPYCGHPQEICHDDDYGYEEGQTHQQECGKCEKTFAYTTSINYYYEAEKAEEILKDFIRKETEYLQSCNPTNELGEITGNDFAAGLVRGMNKVLEEYTSQFKPSGGWIDVKERLPESGYYLAIDVWGSITPFVGHYNTVEWRDANGKWRFPTHWMPLPQSPK